jgi:3'(2'), 5'-bisphosphate nucleotidase
MRMDHVRLAAVMRQLAVEAGAAIMAVRARPDMGTRAKDDASPVTEADEAADAIIAAGLRAAFPDVPLVTEEQAASHDLRAESFLIVDPLDGTREFVQRRGDFTVNIAWVEAGVPRAGVVHAPARGRLFATLPGGGAVEVDLATGTERPIRAATADMAALRVVASKSHFDAETEAFIARYRPAALVNAGSSLKFCLVAAGEADLYPRLGRTMEWDTAAGDAVLRAAGGRVLRADDLTPLAYGKPGWENPPFIACGPGVTLL